MSEIARQPTDAPTLSRMERKANTTDEAFRTIVATETAARDRKTARLKALRMEKEAAEETAAPKKSKAKKK